MKSIKMFGKSVPLLAIISISILVIGVGAGLLSQYGSVVMTATVEQSVVLDGVGSQIDQSLTGFAGGTYYFKHYLENRAPISAGVNFATTYAPELTPGTPEIVTTIYALAPKTILELSSKDAAWEADYRMTATLTFDTVAPQFNYELTATGLVEGTEYALIYYADQSNRFANWGGDNPGKVIATFTSELDGTATVTGSPNLAMNLPSPEDANIAEYDYNDPGSGGTGDLYVHAHGAKIWIVPVTALGVDVNGVLLPMDEWVAGDYLYETELIVYLDCNEEVEDSVAEMIVETGVGYAVVVPSPLTIDSGETVGLLFSYSFIINVDTTPYTITTKVVPAP